MPANLPDGYSWRPATVADAEAILPLVAACNIAAVGFADCTLDDIRDDFTKPGFTPETDTWLVHEPSGTVAGYAWAHQRGTSDHVDVEVITQDDRLSTWLYPKVLARAEELVRAAGHGRADIQKGIYREDAKGRVEAEAHGFTPATTFYRMRIDHVGTPAAPIAPHGVTLRTGPGDEKFRRTAHAVLAESFKDHFGWVPIPFEDWHRMLDQESTFDWSMLTVAELDSHPVGVLIPDDRFVETDNCGHVGDIGVLAAARGKGIAKYLLRTAFAADVQAGRTGTLLHVDTNNTTPALGVYESVGMRPVLVIDLWRRFSEPER